MTTARIGNRTIIVDPRRVRDAAPNSDRHTQKTAAKDTVYPVHTDSVGDLAERSLPPSMQTFFFPGLLPGLNELIDAAKTKRTDRRAGSAYTTMKKQYGETLQWQLLKDGAQHVAHAFFEFQWVERDESRDPDNITGGGRKILLDALVKAGVLTDDSRKYVRGWVDRWATDPNNPGVRVTIHNVD